MKSKCLAAIEKFNMLSYGDTVVVGVSGGADSMALLHYLFTNSDYFGIRVIAAHFHHGIRGEEADRDQLYVRSFCQKYEIEFVTVKENIPELSRQLQMSIEECARVRRYEFLQSVASGAKIATAHTNSDSCESFLFNFARGTGLQGLCGIPAVRDNIIRPLIFCSSFDTREYCTHNKVEWCEDSSNSNDQYSRNAIRLHTIPTLKNINSHFEDNAQRCMQILKCENDFLQQETNRVYQECVNCDFVLNVDKLNIYHKAIGSRVLLQYVRLCGCKDVSMVQIERLLSANNGETFTLHNAVRLKKVDNTICVLSENAKHQPFSMMIDEQTDRVHFFNSYVCFKYVDYNDKALDKNNFYIDADKISHPVLRTRDAGDCIRLKERHCTKTIKQLFLEKKVPVSDRSVWPVLADDNGVIWIGEFGVAESRLPDDNSKRILKIEWRHSL